MDERAFWVAVKRWLKGRIVADQQMVAAIDQRFGLGDRKERPDDRPPRPAA